MIANRFEYFLLLNGYNVEIPFFSGDLTISNTEYLESCQNIYSYPIKSKYHILYFFFDAHQDIVFLDKNPERVIRIPSNSVLSVMEGVPHRFVFSSGERPYILVVYYQFSFHAASPEISMTAQHEQELIQKFFQRSRSVMPIHDRLFQELASTNEYLRTITKGDALKLRNQFANIFLSVFQQGCFEAGPDQPGLREELLRANTHYHLLLCLQDPCANAKLESLSTYLHYTPRHTQRLISNCYGDTFSNVTKGFRISYMMGLLCDTDYSLEKICEMVGFSSNKSMFQAFKAATGMSPSGFRRLYRKEDAEG